MKKFVRQACLFLLFVSSVAPLWSQEKVDLETMSRIRYEGFRDSKVMELASGLMDSIGERLTGSPNMKRANEWTRDQLTAMGLVNSHLEAWGPFGRGWANQYVNVRMTSPDVVTLLAYPKAWTPGTGGVIQGKCVRATIDDKKDFDKYKGKLAGMIVILGADAEVKPIAEAPYKRHTDDDLAKLAEYQMPPEHPPFNFAMFVKRQQFVKDLNQFFADEKVLAVIDHSRGTSGGGTVFVQSGGSYKTGETTTVAQLTMASEHWTRIARLLQQKKDVTLELNVNNTFYDDDPMQYDTIAEIPGREKPDEVVIIGAHLDSWDLATGASDNGTGSTAVLEAARALTKLGVKPKRTIRFVLFTGEEQGLNGSKAYVAKHQDELKKISAVLVHDSGTGKVLTIGLMGNYDARETVDRVMYPLSRAKEIGLAEPTLRKEGGSDHVPFDEAGVPGFWCVQEIADYDKTHHSQADTLDRVRWDDLAEGAQVLAVFAYNVAELPELLPRKSPKP